MSKKGRCRLPEPESLGSIISRGRVPGPKRKKQKLELLSVNWSHIAGDRMAEHSAPTRLIRGTLTVSADSPAWAAELSLASDKMMRKIAGIVADESIKKVRVQSRARAGDEAGEIAPKGPDKGNEPEELRGKLGEDIGALDDEGMRKALERLVRASSTSKQSEQEEG